MKVTDEMRELVVRACAPYQEPGALDEAIRAVVALAAAPKREVTDDDAAEVLRKYSEYMSVTDDDCPTCMLAALRAVFGERPGPVALGGWRNEEGDIVDLLQRACRYIQDHAANT